MVRFTNASGCQPKTTRFQHVKHLRLGSSPSSELSVNCHSLCSIHGFHRKGLINVNEPQPDPPGPSLHPKRWPKKATVTPLSPRTRESELRTGLLWDTTQE